MAKRTLDAFFAPPPKKAKPDSSTDAPSAKTSNTGTDLTTTTDSDSTTDSDKTSTPPTTHASYPHAIAALPDTLLSQLTSAPTRPARLITDKPDLDLAYYAPFLAAAPAARLFAFLRSALPFYRVRYSITRGGATTDVCTPRYTTVFGVDDSALFSPAEGLLDAHSRAPVPRARYACTPRPIPACLDALRRATEAATGATFNVCLVNYYAAAADSIAYHSDDERFLGPDPVIASFSLGATRDFLMRHKPLPPSASAAAMSPDARAKAEHAARAPLKFPLASGDMLLMRGRTQSCWLHSIPKRTGKSADAAGGRINITFRRARVPAGTENYYRYNVGDGGAFRWSVERGEMVPLAKS